MKVIWQPIETLEVGKPVLLYSVQWVDEDFNPKGIREGFRDESDTGRPIFCASWNDCGECWVTIVTDEATHWREQPEPPEKINDTKQ